MALGYTSDQPTHSATDALGYCAIIVRFVAICSREGVGNFQLRALEATGRVPALYTLSNTTEY